MSHNYSSSISQKNKTALNQNQKMVKQLTSIYPRASALSVVANSSEVKIYLLRHKLIDNIPEYMKSDLY